MINFRQSLKRAIKTGFLVLIFPVYALYLLLCLAGNIDAVFMSFSQALSLVPGKVGIYIRAAFYCLACTDTSDEISVGFLTIFSHADTTIEKGVYIGPQCNIGKCIIKKETLLGSGVHILSGKNQHGFNDLEQSIQSQPGTFYKVTIGEDCWIGNGSIIMANIGDQSVIAAGSVIVNDTENLGIFAGNPAKLVRKRA
ncbi:Acetyltransferase (isoleucine patch superfamily) [Marinobacter antarcticus]|uniref:Acetyltransferase (Isoleucine patch superfamily) n=1 Tax=Marinobacter antarcticus TaxID=564117 RepID=A0A1M6SNE1_9GAMM|nr:acyltransferase [Marinobacter antarcticus]SHK46139.1 Acetyltransferase (isoleucine patch superfamily) [Marinobacter antarcticus]